jgi:hypothetical protein
VYLPLVGVESSTEREVIIRAIILSRKISLICELFRNTKVWQSEKRRGVSGSVYIIENKRARIARKSQRRWLVKQFEIGIVVILKKGLRGTLIRFD